MPRRACGSAVALGQWLSRCAKQNTRRTVGQVLLRSGQALRVGGLVLEYRPSGRPSALAVPRAPAELRGFRVLSILVLGFCASGGGENDQ